MLRPQSSRKGMSTLLLAGGLLMAEPQITYAQTTPTLATQQPSINSREFEVATIKPISSDGMHMVGIRIQPSGRLTIQTFSLKDLICAAFDLSPWQLTGGDSMEKQRYDVVAQPTEAVSVGTYDTRHTGGRIADSSLRQMLQSLLIERFHLKFHMETKTGTVYLLEQTGKPVPLMPIKAVPGSDSPYPSGDIGAVGGRGWSLHDTSMPELARFLSDYLLHQPVLDRTGLSGAFDFRSRYILANEDFKNPDFSSTLLPVLKEMELKLESTKGQVVSFVIDRAEPPTAN